MSRPVIGGLPATTVSPGLVYFWMLPVKIKAGETQKIDLNDSNAMLIQGGGNQLVERESKTCTVGLAANLERKVLTTDSRMAERIWAN